MRIRQTGAVLAAVIAGALLPVAGNPGPALAACKAVPVIAHRGGNEVYDENTRNAFRHASTLGAGVVWEMDVRFDSAGTPFVIHDDTLDRTTNGSGLIGDQDLSVARTNGLRTDDGQVVPSLYEVMTDAAARNARALVEIKDDPTPAELSKVLARLDWTGMRGRVVLNSFFPEILAKIQAAAPDIRTGLDEDPSYRPVGELTALGIEVYIKHQWSITAARLDEWSGPLDVYAWTVDSATDWDRMHWYTSEPGRLDGVITNKPAAYLAWEHAHGC